MALGTEHFLKYGEINPNIWIRPPPRAGGVEGLVPYRRFCISSSQALLKNCMTTGPGSYITIGVLLARHRYLPYSRIQISRAIDKKDAFVEPSVKFLSQRFQSHLRRSHPLSFQRTCSGAVEDFLTHCIALELICNRLFGQI